MFIASSIINNRVNGMHNSCNCLAEDCRLLITVVLSYVTDILLLSATCCQSFSTSPITAPKWPNFSGLLQRLDRDKSSVPGIDPIFVMVFCRIWLKVVIVCASS